MTSLTSGAPAALNDAGHAAEQVVEEWNISNDLNRKVVVEALDGSTFVLAPFERSADVKRVVVEQFALTRWTDKISAEGKSESQSEGMLGAIGGGVWFAIAWGILAAFVGTPTWWIYAWVAL